MEDIVTLTMNPALDVSTAVERVSPTHKLYCRETRRDAGGGGINVARVVHRLGGGAVAVYPAGGRYGELLRAILLREGVQSVCVPVLGETRENFTVFEEETGEQFRFVLPGPRLNEAEWRSCAGAVAGRQRAPAAVVLSGSLPPGVPKSLYADLAGLMRPRGSFVAVDTSGPALEAALEAGVDLAKPNLRELEQLTGRTLDGEVQRIAACRARIEAGRTAMVALSLGPEGALLVTAGRVLRAAAPPVEPLSTVGAGDSFLAALVHGLVRRHRHAEALRTAVAAGTAALLSPGTDLCRADDVRRLVPSVTVEEVAPA